MFLKETESASTFRISNSKTTSSSGQIITSRIRRLSNVEKVLQGRGRWCLKQECKLRSARSSSNQIHL
ncbi:hypothetical protein VNO80_22608 [Phaseolus coccineus]|uniref:Uncharacterized protein n=1 Tax=Phaseolus coccineus TaxID=3886 RepID=A0AAN9M5F0_PHACN